MDDPLQEVRGRTFVNDSVVLDGKAFIDCTFDHCDLCYHGGPVTFKETGVYGCSWSFGGPAQRTLNLLEFFQLETPEPEMPERLFVS